MPHLISIISEQAVPNLLFIRQFEQPESDYYFVTTQEMEAKQATDNLISALKLPVQRCKKITIDANNALLIKRQLENTDFPKEGQYLINTTGGNKLMSQMVYQHFSGYDSIMYYAPINSDNYQVMYPEIQTIPKSPQAIVTLDEYLEAYGFSIESTMVYYESKPTPTALFLDVIKKGNPGYVKQISKVKNPEYIGEDKQYLNGEWFELYCFHVFKKAFDLQDSQIACSVKIKKKGSTSANSHDNEFDLMFVFMNDLYVFECKVFAGRKLKVDKLHDPMFKLTSLTRNFGLRCKKYLAVLGDFAEGSQSKIQLENLQVNLGIDKILDIDVFRNANGRDLLRTDLDYKLDMLLTKFNKKQLT